ncbi:MAG: HD domain-containing phosphohydrolase [Pyrinomonadaceae bacterium]
MIVGLMPLLLAGWLLSQKSASQLRSIEGRYQAQLVQDKARQIELYVERYREVVIGLTRAFELAGGIPILNGAGASADTKLEKTLQEDPNLMALAILPVKGEPRWAFQPDVINREEMNERMSEVLATMNNRGAVVSRPRGIASGREIGFTVAAPIMLGPDEREVTGAVVAIIYFKSGFKTMQQLTTKSEQEILDEGLPLVFVVDSEGCAVAHPDEEVSFSERPMRDLKVVQDWLATGSQVQSALAPFTLERNNQRIDVLGAYATARLDAKSRLGVIAVQDERTALSSVADMRRETRNIGLFAAAVTLLIGFFFANQLTQPVLELAEAAHRIAAGDFSRRISVKSRTEIGDLGDSFNLMTDRIERFVKDLQSAAEENRQLFLGTVKALAAAIDGKDPYTRGHSERVARISVAIGERMKLAESEVETLRISALLHDVGKIGIDDNILKKPAPLTDEEYEIMKGHPQKGFRIMSQIPAMKDFLPGMYMHHETLDGNGYPQGLMGDEIPMQARIVAVADAFDAMTTDRPYQQAQKLADALQLITSFIGTRYDESVVHALTAACEAGQIRPGTVKLRHKD